MPQQGREEVQATRAASRWCRSTVRLVLGAGALLALAGAGVLGLLLFGRPALSLSSPTRALVQVHVRGVADVRDVSATTGGRTVPLAKVATGYVPTSPLPQGSIVRVTAVATPPSWLRWLLGSGLSVSIRTVAPTVSPSSAVALTSRAGRLAVRFDHPVRVVEYRMAGDPPAMRRLVRATATVDLDVPPAVARGTVRIAAAAQPWEHLSPPSTVTWFVAPKAHGPVVVPQPIPASTNVSMTEPLTLTFDQPVADVMGDRRPTISPAVAGKWSEPKPDVLLFTPSPGFGYGPGAQVSVHFDRRLTIVGTAKRTGFGFGVRSGSMLRLEELLAELHYLPLNFVPGAGSSEPTTFAGEVASIDRPLLGRFTWRWPTTPAALKAQWNPTAPNPITRGALLSFVANGAGYDGYAADGETVGQLATPSTWRALLEDALSNKLDAAPYAYVYVSERLPEMLSLWENGSVLLRARANTGIPAAPTATGTYPIYIRYRFNYMSGFNPDGSYYHDPVYWIDYFNGGDAVHGFVRASYGYPQSLGCVELPIQTAATVFAHLGIGDLVTVAT